MSSKKIYKIINLRLDNNRDATEALKGFSEFLDENNSEKQIDIRGAIRKRALNLHEELFSSIQQVHFQLDHIYNDVNDMFMAVTEMSGRLATTRNKTKTLIEKTTNMQKKIAVVDQKLEFSNSLINAFQLTPVEKTEMRASPVSLDMLHVMRKAKAIYKKCDVLDSNGCGALASDVRDQMFQYEQEAIEKLFHWVRTRCRSIEQPDPTALLPRAVEKLMARPELFNQIMEEYCANKRDLVVRQFISALTRGASPIEHRVTEPTRYVGDMLAWLHQTIPIEKDNLAFMLRNCDSSDLSDKVQLALDTITEGVCHPLKVRIEHILLGENVLRDPVLVLTLLGLLRYYHEIIKQIVGEGKILSVLSELMETAEKTVIISLTGRVAVMLGSRAEKPGANLELFPGAHQALNLLAKVLAVDITTPAELIQKIASCVLDSVLISITESATKLSSAEASVYLLNAYNHIEGAIALNPFLDDRLQRLRAFSDAQIDSLTSEQASALVAHLSLGAIYTALQGPLPQPLSSSPIFESSRISSVSAKLHGVLQNPEVYMVPQLALLTNVSQRKQVVRNAGNVINSIYSQLYQLVHDHSNLYENPGEILPIKPEQVQDVFNRH